MHVTGRLRGRLPNVLLGILMIMLSTLATAQVVPPVPEEPAADGRAEPPARVSLHAREQASGITREGWVKVRYSVLSDGTTADVRVVEARPPAFETEPAVSEVRRWRFQPATDGGQPIDWHNNVSVVVFELPEPLSAPNRAFIDSFDAVSANVAEGRFDRAKTLNESMQRDAVRTLHELGLANMQLAEIEAERGDLLAAYDAARVATQPGVNMLTGEDLLYALDYRFVAEVELNRGVDALQTYERRIAIEPFEEDDPMAVHANLVAAVLEEDDQALAVVARLDDDAWMHTLHRRTFTVTNVDGTLEDVDVECNRSKATLPFQSDVDWSIPESWGECTVFFNGSSGTTFVVYEFE